MPLAVPMFLARAEGPGGALPQLLLPLVIFAIFYWILFAPMRKRQKALQAVIDNLEKGNRVLTNGGLYGEVVAVEGNVVILRIADNVKVKVAKSAVAGLEGQPGTEGART